MPAQEALEKERPGTTIVLVLLSTDKTLLTTFQNKTAYPLYMTIGNIPKEIRRKPSKHAHILLAYLPTTCLTHVSNQAQRRQLLLNLYHSCMQRILEPLETARMTGVYMACGNGQLHWAHPIFTAFIGDYPEQILSTGSISGKCPMCNVDHDHLGDYDLQDTNQLQDLESVLKILDTFNQDPAGFLTTCASARIKPIINPFWINLPYAHIFHCITPDILHQIYQGLVKHIVRWLIKVIGAEEVDTRCQWLPPNHNLHTFTKGISTLSHVTSCEHNQMCQILLALAMDVPLPGSISNACLLQALRALMDFTFITQYPMHSEETLELLEDTLSHFHESKSIFIDLQIPQHFNLPKLHFASHYVNLIKLYGTTDNFNLEYTKRLHINCPRLAYTTTNHKDKFTQMTTWQERQEKIHWHACLVQWWLDGSPPIIESPTPQKWIPPGLELDRKLFMSMHPSVHRVPLDSIETEYGATHFCVALQRYIVLSNSSQLTMVQVKHSLWEVHLPFWHLPVWHRSSLVVSNPTLASPRSILSMPIPIGVTFTIIIFLDDSTPRSSTMELGVIWGSLVSVFMNQTLRTNTHHDRLSHWMSSCYI